MNLIPHNEKLERSLLGGLLLSHNEFVDLQELFHEDLFHDSNNKIVARAIKTLYGENASFDLVTVTQWIKSQGLSKVCDEFYVAKLTVSGALLGLKKLVMLLNQYYVRRAFILKNHELINSAVEETCDIEYLIDLQERNLNEVTSKIAVGATSNAQDCHQELIKHLSVLDKLGEGELIGVDTGFRELNRLTAGWQKTDLVIQAGRPGMGKTSFMLNCVHAAVRNVPTLVFSLEMSKLQLYARLCSQITSIPLEYLLKRGMGTDYRSVFEKETRGLSISPFYIEDKGGMDMSYIKTKARKLARDKGIGIIFVDYLQLISRPKSNKSTNDEISEVSGSLKSMAKELNIPIVALSQLTRAVEATADKRPSLVHLRDGGSIEQDADVVQFIYRPEYYGIMDDGLGGSTIGKAEIITAKNRNGALGTTVMGFDGRCTNFYEFK